MNDCFTVRKILLVAVTIVALSGCTHGRLLDRGQDAFNQGRYEDAASYYQQALARKPDRIATRQQLTSAERNYQQWLDSLEVAAIEAYREQYFGKALLLYGKVLTERPTAEFKPQYQALLQQLSEPARFYGTLRYAPELGPGLELEINDFNHLDEIGIANDYSIEFIDLGKTISERDETRSGEYVSGVLEVHNPDFHQLKHELEHLQEQVAKTRHKTHQHKKDLKQLHKELHRATDPEKTAYLEIEIREVEKKLQHSQERYDELCGQLDSVEEEFLHTPATLLEEQYATHFYTVTFQTVQRRGELLITTPNGTFVEPVKLEWEDSYHQQQPLLNLNFDPLEQPSEEFLTDNLHQHSREQALGFMEAQIKLYRESLLIAANNTIDPAERLEAWVHYGFSGNSGVSGAIAKRMADQLQNEVGNGGNFAINSLLYP